MCTTYVDRHEQPGELGKLDLFQFHAVNNSCCVMQNTTHALTPTNWFPATNITFSGLSQTRDMYVHVSAYRTYMCNCTHYSV